MHVRTVRQGDEFYCPYCRCRWGADEDEPEACVPEVGERQPPKAVQERLMSKTQLADGLKQLRETLEDGQKDGKRT